MPAPPFCPLLPLGIRWPRPTRTGAMWGLALGGGTSSLAVVASLGGMAGAGAGDADSGRHRNVDGPAGEIPLAGRPT